MSKYQDLNQATYNAIALKYDDVYGEIPTAITFAKKLAKLMIKKTDPRILDLGCGSGSILKVFEAAIPTAKLIGVDFSSELLSLAKKKLKRATLIQKDITLFNSEEHFDLIIATFSLIHLTDEELNDIALRIKNMLNQNGYLYLSFILGKEEKIVTEVLDPSKHVYFNYHSQTEILELFPKEEFEIIEMLIDEVKDEYESEEDLYLILQRIT